MSLRGAIEALQRIIGPRHPHGEPCNVCKWPPPSCRTVIIGPARECPSCGRKVDQAGRSYHATRCTEILLDEVLPPESA